jgi:3-phenylpropionate/cinnamic acid dioxygenase small subunit
VSVEQFDPSLHLGVSAVIVRYASGIDRRDWDLFRSCFTPDCTVDYGEIGVWSGVDEITTFMVEVHEKCGFTLHRISNVSVQGLRDGAQVQSYVDAVIMGPDNRDGVRAIGFYDDQLVHSDRDGWQIARRHFTTVHVGTVGQGALG